MNNINKKWLPACNTLVINVQQVFQNTHNCDLLIKFTHIEDNYFFFKYFLNQILASVVLTVADKLSEIQGKKC